MNATDILFEKIKSFVEAGNEINSFYEDRSVLYEFLEEYYQLVVYDPNVEYDDDYYAEELWVPLKERSNKIFDQMNWLIEHGADLNAGGEWLPLMPPVAYLDYSMVEFLLENGANAQYDSNEDGEIPYGCGNYYIDDLDVTLLNYSFEPNAKKEVFDQVLKIATLFAKHGVTNVHTHCISIDGESRIVSVTQAKVKY